MRYLAIIIALCLIPTIAFPATPTAKAKVYLIKTSDRIAGINYLLSRVVLPDLSLKNAVIKADFNSDHPFPATTHIDTSQTVIKALKAASPESISIVERSGMGKTEEVLRNRGLYPLAASEEVAVVNIDELEAIDWVIRGTQEAHWREGFPVPRVVANAEYIINLPTLKTHRFLGDFALSLKNYLGFLPKWYNSRDYVCELQSSQIPHTLIAEVNRDIRCDLIILDAIQGYATEGPNRGKLIKPEIILLSTDRVAIDAVALAILRYYGTTDKISAGRIFDQAQIKAAAEIGLGVESEDDIELIVLNAESEPDIIGIKEILYKKFF